MCYYVYDDYNVYDEYNEIDVKKEKRRIAMNQIILASHGGMSAGLKSTLELILGEVPNVYAVATTREETEPILAATRHLLDSFDPEDSVYICTDVLGGSVNNDMLTLLGDYPDLTILCGTNAGLALCLALAEGPISEAELEDIIRQSREQIINCTRLMKDTPEYEEEDL